MREITIEIILNLHTESIINVHWYGKLIDHSTIEDPREKLHLELLWVLQKWEHSTQESPEKEI